MDAKRTEQLIDQLLDRYFALDRLARAALLGKLAADAPDALDAALAAIEARQETQP